MSENCGVIYSLLNNEDAQSAIEFAAAASCFKHSIGDDYNMVSFFEEEALVRRNVSGQV